MGQKTSKNWLRATVICGTVFAAICAFTGCSTSLFTGSTSNDQAPSNSTINQKCIDLNLSSAVLTAPMLRSLMNCLNSNGSIQAYQDLLNTMSDADLTSILDIVNQELISSPDRLKEVIASLDQMDSQGYFDQALNAVAGILDNGNFVAALLTAVQKGGQDPTVKDRLAVDPAILKAVAIAASEMSSYGAGGVANMERAMDVQVDMLQSASYKAMVRGLQPALIQGRTLQGLAAQVLAYFQAKIAEPANLKYLRAVLEGIADSSIYSGLDYFYHQECEGAAPGACGSRARLSVDQQVLSMEAFVRYLTVDRRDVLQKLTNLFGTMNRPILCLDGTTQIPNADLYTMDQMTSMDPLAVPEWAIRQNRVKLKFAAGLCDYPVGMNDLISALTEMADPESAGYPRGAPGYEDSTLVTIAHFTQGLTIGDQNSPSGVQQRFRTFLIDWLGDLSQVSAYTNLTDTLAEFSRPERRIVANLLYFLNAPDQVDRGTLSYVMSRLLLSRADFASLPQTQADPSIYGVLKSVVDKVDAPTFYQLLNGMSGLINASGDIVVPLALANRNALWMNNVHPFVEIGLDVASKADGIYQGAFNTIFGVAAKPELQSALQLTATMARNGSLKELLKGLLLPFRSTANLSSINPVIQAVPPVRVSLNPDHESSTDTAGVWTPTPPYWTWTHQEALACENLDLSNSIVPPSMSGSGISGSSGVWQTQMQDFGSCSDLDRDGTALPEPMQDFTDYALQNNVGSESLMGYLVNLGADFVHTDANLKQIYQELGDLLLQNDTFADLSNLQQLMQFLFHNRYGAQGLSVAQAALRMLPVFNQAGPNGQERLQPLLNVGADAVQSASLPQAASLTYDLLDAAEKEPAPAFSAKVPPTSMPVQEDNTMVLDQLRTLLDQVEKPATVAAREQRVQQIIQDYFTNVQSPVPNAGYKTAADFKAAFKPLLDQIAQGTRLEWILAFMHYFESDPYDPQWFEGWFHRLSSHVFPISYIYPGQKTPQVRLASYFDLLELIVDDADFSLNEIGQINLSWLDGYFLKGSDVLAIRHLAILGTYAPGQDMSKWVNELDAELDTFDSIPKIFGLDPLVPEVRRHLANLKQVAFVVHHLNQMQDPQGRNDLGVLRDLFKMLNASMPVSQRRNYDRNHALNVVTALTESGLLRMIGKNIWILDAQGHKVAVSLAPILQFLRDAAVTPATVPNGVRSTNPDTLALFDFLLRKDYKPGVNLATASFNDRYVFLGQFIDQYFAWIQNDACGTSGGACTEAAIKDAVYNFAHFAGDSDVRFNNTNNLQTVLRTAISAKYAPFLGAHLDVLQDILATPKAGNFWEGLTDSSATRPQDYAAVLDLGRSVLADLAANGGSSADLAVSLVQDLKEDPMGRWDAFSNTVDAMQADPSYISYHDSTFEPILATFMHWLPKDTALRPRLQTYLGAHLSDGPGTEKIRDLIRFGAQQAPNDSLYQKLEFIGEPGYIQGYQNFLSELRSGLQSN